MTAVRAAVGFVHQGGIRVVRGDDGTLLLVPASDGWGEMQALGGGTLARTPEGCLVLGHGDHGVQLLLWPCGTTWDTTSEVLTVPPSEAVTSPTASETRSASAAVRATASARERWCQAPARLARSGSVAPRWC